MGNPTQKLYERMAFGFCTFACFSLLLCSFCIWHHISLSWDGHETISRVLQFLGGIFIIGIPIEFILSVVFLYLYAPRGGWLRGFIAFACICFVILLILAAMAIPSFMRFQPRAKQIEAKENLKEIYSRENDYKADTGRYAKTFQELDWHPQHKLLFHYLFLFPTEKIESDQDVCAEGRGAPVKSTDERCGQFHMFVNDNDFQIFACGCLAGGYALDVWSINEKGELKNVVDGVKAKKPAGIKF
jgi:Tfp pilus assembly protein PilE